jgi:hypothetical protein
MADRVQFEEHFGYPRKSICDPNSYFICGLVAFRILLEAPRKGSFASSQSRIVSPVRARAKQPSGRVSTQGILLVVPRANVPTLPSMHCSVARHTKCN